MGLDVVIYSADTDLSDMLQSMLGIEANVSLAEEGQIIDCHLGCIIVDMAFSNRSMILDSLRDLQDNVIVVASANPFSVSQLGNYGIDAFLSKPLSSEAVQAMLLGVKARLSQKGYYG